MPRCPAHRDFIQVQRWPLPHPPHLTSFSASSNPKFLLSGTSVSLTPFPALPTPSCPSLPPDWGWGCLSLWVLGTSGQDSGPCQPIGGFLAGGSGANSPLAAQLLQGGQAAWRQDEEGDASSRGLQPAAHDAPWDPTQGSSMGEGLYALIASGGMNLGRESRRACSSGLGSRTDSCRATGQTPSQASVSSGATLGAQSCSRAALSNRTFCNDGTVLHCPIW